MNVNELVRGGEKGIRTLDAVSVKVAQTIKICSSLVKFFALEHKKLLKVSLE